MKSELLALRLNPFAVVTRYDDEFWPEADEVREAIHVASTIRKFAESRLPPPKS